MLVSGAIVKAVTGLRVKQPEYRELTLNFGSGGGNFTVLCSARSISNPIQPQSIMVDNTENINAVIVACPNFKYIVPAGATAGFPVVMGANDDFSVLSPGSGVTYLRYSDSSIPAFLMEPPEAAQPSGAQDVLITNPDPIPVTISGQAAQGLLALARGYTTSDSIMSISDDLPAGSTIVSAQLGFTSDSIVTTAARIHAQLLMGSSDILADVEHYLGTTPGPFQSWSFDWSKNPWVVPSTGYNLNLILNKAISAGHFYANVFYTIPPPS